MATAWIADKLDKRVQIVERAIHTIGIDVAPLKVTRSSNAKRLLTMKSDSNQTSTRYRRKQQKIGCHFLAYAAAQS
jgi:hypothetical protein